MPCKTFRKSRIFCRLLTDMDFNIEKSRLIWRSRCFCWVRSWILFIWQKNRKWMLSRMAVHRQSYLNFLSWLSSRWSYWTFAKLPGSRTNSMLSLRTIPINRGRTRVLRKRLEVNLFGRSWRQYRLRNFRNYLKLSLPFFLSVRTLLLLAIRLIYSCKDRFFTRYRTDLHYMPEIQACSMLLDDIIFTRVLRAYILLLFLHRFSVFFYPWVSLKNWSKLV